MNLKGHILVLVHVQLAEFQNLFPGEHINISFNLLFHHAGQGKVTA